LIRRCETAIAALLVGLALASPSSARHANACDGEPSCSVDESIVLEGVHGVEVSFVVADASEHLWVLISDCMRWPRYLQFLDDCMAIPGRPGYYRSVLHIAGKKRRVICHGTHDDAGRVEMHRIDGDFRMMVVRWSLEPLGSNQTRVRFAVAADVAWYVSNATVRGLIRGLLPDVIAGVRRYVGESRAGDATQLGELG
jgi:ribosome-associated toxin RatA of RatAB toxin-antitoxin module